MLLFEVAAMCSRHGIPVDTSNPSAARHAAGLLLRSLGLTVAAPAPEAIAGHPVRPLDATVQMERVTEMVRRTPRAPEPARFVPARVGVRGNDNT